MDLEDPMMEVVQTHIIPSEETIDADVVQVPKVKIGFHIQCNQESNSKTFQPNSLLSQRLYNVLVFLLKDF